MRLLRTVTCCLLGAIPTFASPLLVPRQNSSSHPLNELMQSAIGTWLASANVSFEHARMVPGGTELTWIGNSPTNVSKEDAKNSLVDSLDWVVLPNAKEETSFSRSYSKFVQGILEALKLDDPDSIPGMEDLSLADITDIDELFYKAYGEVYEAFSNSTNNMNMSDSSTAEDIDEFGACKENGKDEKKADLPEYTIPGLEETISGWQKEGNQSQPAFFWSSEQATTNDTTKIFFGATRGSSNRCPAEVPDEADKQVDKDKRETDNDVMTASRLKVHFGHLRLMDVKIGQWFNGWHLAYTTANPDRTETQDTKKVFEEAFGSKDEPKPASTFNMHAIVAHKIYWEVKFDSQANYDRFMDADIAESAKYLFFDDRSKGTKTEELVNKSNETLTVWYESKSNNGVVLGYIQESYWDKQRS